jgi:hypothetical protein
LTSKRPLALNVPYSIIVTSGPKRKTHSVIREPFYAVLQVVYQYQNGGANNIVPFFGIACVA